MVHYRFISFVRHGITFTFLLGLVVVQLVRFSGEGEEGSGE